MFDKSPLEVGESRLSMASGSSNTLVQPLGSLEDVDKG